ncbi:toprim domain-containing protein [Dysosmobacter sp.]|uniref:toprim domain-containing protein n=1 Tax=Dysosmobacter sp. TaxID=2591382 RepID=UPI003AB57A81
MKHTETGTDHRFTDAEMEIARETDLPDLLEHLGYQIRRVGSYHTTKEMDSLRIKNRRTWFRYSEQTGGDAITFLQRFCNKSFREAVEYLLAFHGRSRDSPARPHPKAMAEPEKIPFALPQANTDHRRVFAYLQKRGIAPQVIRAFLSSGLLYEDAQHHNCVFVGRDASGEPRFASRRGTYDLNGPGFKRDVAGSDKRVAFRLPSRPELDWVLVFEAPIDLMSYLTLHRQVTSNAIALCGLYEGALDTYLRDNPPIRRIALCLDADGPGQAAAERLQAKYEGLGYIVKIQRPPRGKDWNEYLQQRCIKERRLEIS